MSFTGGSHNRARFSRPATRQHRKSLERQRYQAAVMNQPQREISAWRAAQKAATDERNRWAEDPPTLTHQHHAAAATNLQPQQETIETTGSASVYHLRSAGPISRQSDPLASSASSDLPTPGGNAKWNTWRRQVDSAGASQLPEPPAPTAPEIHPEPSTLTDPQPHLNITKWKAAQTTAEGAAATLMDFQRDSYGRDSNQVRHAPSPVIFDAPAPRGSLDGSPAPPGDHRDDRNSARSTRLYGSPAPPGDNWDACGGTPAAGATRRRFSRRSHPP
jgi:hypothetical protein